MKTFACIFAAIWLAATISFISMRIEFAQKCTGFLEQAADANTIELALDRLDRAIHYVEKKGWTDGYTSILWRTEDENVGFWYANLKASRQELVDAKESTQLEQTNVLMKLRETLTDSSDGTTYITYPCGLWKYPHNGLFALLSWVVNILMVVAVAIFLAWISDEI